MKNKKGFTLVELLAVIVILAIILVIAVPQIIRTIDAARLSAFRSSAKMILTTAEKDYIVRQTLDQYYTGGTYDCKDYAKLDENDYITGGAGTQADPYKCSVKIEENSNHNIVATLNMMGKKGSKFNSYGCKDATLANLEATTNATCDVNKVTYDNAGNGTLA